MFVLTQPHETLNVSVAKKPTSIIDQSFDAVNKAAIGVGYATLCLLTFWADHTSDEISSLTTASPR